MSAVFCGCRNSSSATSCRRRAYAAPPGPRSLLRIDEPGFVPLSKTGAELLFVLFSQRCERGATLITSNLQFEEWTETFGTERLTGALLDRLTHHVHILKMDGDSYQLSQSRARKAHVSV